MLQLLHRRVKVLRLPISYTGAAVHTSKYMINKYTYIYINRYYQYIYIYIINIFIMLYIYIQYMHVFVYTDTDIYVCMYVCMYLFIAHLFASKGSLHATHVHFRQLAGSG